MNRAQKWLAAAALLGLCWLGGPGLAEGAPRPHVRPRPPVVVPRYHIRVAPVQPIYPRIAPYQGYHVHRRVVVPYARTYPVPYPIVYPYQVPVPYAVYVPAPALPLPTVTEALPSPPPGTALIHVQVSDPWTTIRLDGVDTATTGLDRWFVTPRLEEGRTYRYTVKASWVSNGWYRHESEQVVLLKAGEVRTVNFTASPR